MTGRSESGAGEPVAPLNITVSPFGLVLNDQRWHVEFLEGATAQGLRPMALCTVTDTAHSQCNRVVEELEYDSATGRLFFQPPNPSKYFIFTHVPPLKTLHIRVIFVALDKNMEYTASCSPIAMNFLYHFRTRPLLSMFPRQMTTLTSPISED